MTDRADITPELLRQLIRFEEGRYFWNPRPREMFKSDAEHKRWKNQYSNTETMRAGKGRGYIAVAVLGLPFLAHRVAWAIHYGRWPLGDIDHINGIRRDNRIANLRSVTKSENCRNAKRYATCKTGHTGVTLVPSSKKWEARISVNGKLHYLGVYANIDDAVAARLAANRKFGFHPNHGRAGR